MLAAKGFGMRQIGMQRSEMAALCPAIVTECEQGADGASDIGYFLAFAILPGAEAIPMDVEADPDAIRLWMERSLLLQARASRPGRPGRTRAIRGHVPIPASVAALIHTLTYHEADRDPDPATINARLALRLAAPHLDPATPWEPRHRAPFPTGPRPPSPFRPR